MTSLTIARSLARRILLTHAFAVFALLASGIGGARAQDAAAAASFVQGFGEKLVAVVNSDEPVANKEKTLRPLIDSAVDVDAIARFCLGRFASQATPEQLTEFTQLFHSVLVDNITGKIGEYRGVTFRMADSAMRGSEAFVGTIVQRPNNAPVNVRWVVSTASGAEKVVDVVAEGTSLRLTQRSDYASYLSHNGNNIGALLSAMKRQVAASAG